MNQFQNSRGFKTFQFHKGSIRTIPPVSVRIPLSSFNSIKVQLEPPPPDKKTRGFALFQFHKGSIRTRKRHLQETYYPGFNSIKVQLELVSLQVSRQVVDCFNSIKVQLERVRISTKHSKPVFQFHKGSIRT